MTDPLIQAARLFRKAASESFFRGGTFEEAILALADGIEVIATSRPSPPPPRPPRTNGSAKPKMTRMERSAAAKARWAKRKAAEEKRL